MRRMLALLFCVLAFSIAGPQPPAAARRSGAWVIIGPGGGGTLFYPTVSPHDSKHVLASCDMTGGYLSTNGGESWRMFNLRGVVRFFLFDPLDARTMYAENGALWRSRDRGTKWELVYPDPALVKGVSMDDDHAWERFLTPQGPAEQITALAIDPAASSTLYAVFRSGERSRLSVSRDAGKSWNTLTGLPGHMQKIYLDPRSPREGRTAYLVGANAVSVWQAGKFATHPAAPGVARFTDSSAAWAPDGRLVVYAVSSRAGVFVSEDGGASWRAPSGPLAGTQMPAVAAAASDASIAYVSYGRLRQDGQMWFGVARTSDRGRNWSLVWKESREPAGNVHGGWLTERFGPDWPGNPSGLGVAPRDPNLCYGTDSGRVMRTTDGGKTWQSVTSRRLSSGGDTTTGLDVTTTYGVHFDPFDRRHMFISYTDVGLMESRDGGISWSSATAHGVPPRWVNTTYWLEFDPDVKGRVWAAMSGTHDLPRPKMWRGRSPATYVGGVLRSDDGGRTWSGPGRGMPPTAATHILLDRRSSAQARVLYAAGYGKGVFKSTDGGESWTLTNKGIDGAEPFAWRLAQDAKGVLYLVAARRSDDGSIGTPNDGALYRSHDGAESWQRVALPEGVNGPNGLAIDPQDPGRLYLTVWHRLGAGGGGIYVSNDAGRSWRNVHRADQHVYDITADPRVPGTLYACGFTSSAWRSTNRGETWQRIPGFNFKWGHRVIPDPYDQRMIYITTFGGSVWYGPAAGDPRANED
ncbi:MAG TPA: hypothetical protein VHA11_15435, partial [Bryobacteraceae bacterium]|nr:hypothetical protein [Bryobacteraceae bacterium]